MSKDVDSAGLEFKMAIAGPIASFFLAFLFYLIGQMAFWGGSWIWASIGFELAFINFLLGAFNLVPAFPLDGGRVFRAFLWRLPFFDKLKATKVASWLGEAFAFSLMGWGFLGILFGGFINGFWFILIGWFLKQAAKQSYQQLVFEEVAGLVKVKEIMVKKENFEGWFCKPEESVLDILPRLQVEKLLLVVDDKGELQGMVSTKSAMQLMKNPKASRSIKQNKNS